MTTQLMWIDDYRQRIFGWLSTIRPPEHKSDLLLPTLYQPNALPVATMLGYQFHQNDIGQAQTAPFAGDTGIPMMVAVHSQPVDLTNLFEKVDGLPWFMVSSQPLQFDNRAFSQALVRARKTSASATYHEFLVMLQNHLRINGFTRRLVISGSSHYVTNVAPGAPNAIGGGVPLGPDELFQVTNQSVTHDFSVNSNLHGHPFTRLQQAGLNLDVNAYSVGASSERIGVFSLLVTNPQKLSELLQLPIEVRFFFENIGDGKTWVRCMAIAKGDELFLQKIHQTMRGMTGGALPFFSSISGVRRISYALSGIDPLGMGLRSAPGTTKIPDGLTLYSLSASEANELIQVLTTHVNAGKQELGNLPLGVSLMTGDPVFVNQDYTHFVVVEGPMGHGKTVTAQALFAYAKTAKVLMVHFTKNTRGETAGKFAVKIGGIHRQMDLTDAVSGLGDPKTSQEWELFAQVMEKEAKDLVDRWVEEWNEEGKPQFPIVIQQTYGDQALFARFVRILIEQMRDRIFVPLHEQSGGREYCCIIFDDITGITDNADGDLKEIHQNEGLALRRLIAQMSKASRKWGVTTIVTLHSINELLKFEGMTIPLLVKLDTTAHHMRRARVYQNVRHEDIVGGMLEQRFVVETDPLLPSPILRLMTEFKE